jgi:hypothetical protein
VDEPTKRRTCETEPECPQHQQDYYNGPHTSPLQFGITFH